ncbi:MAG: hypothetical protein M1834_001137 [Cirrosporium novae-zelandiae]|nr:MAG: hypothetical protein M1834_001137 [Cirrosporium novae-zelandiae]
MGLLDSDPPIEEKNTSSSGAGLDVGSIMMLDGAYKEFAPREGALCILKVTQILEEAHIPCCLVADSALLYFGAAKIRWDWQICVPTNQLGAAASVLEADIYAKDYMSTPIPVAWPFISYPRFQCTEFYIWFELVPSNRYFIDCKPSNFERSLLGFPYPTLVVYAQSLLDSLNRADLCDLVDGMDLPEIWGYENLDFSGANDAIWTEVDEIFLSIEPPKSLSDTFCLALDRLDMWKDVTRNKKHRLGPIDPSLLFSTQYRFQDDIDPRLTFRETEKGGF